VGLAKNFAWADGHWIIYNTYQANIHVRLLNLLSPEVFSGVKKWSKSSWRSGLCLEPCWRSLQRFPKLLAGLRETGGERKRTEEEEREKWKRKEWRKKLGDG